MQYRKLGPSGLKVSAIGLGTNQFGGKVDRDTMKNIFAAAVDAGINFIDTANIYQKGRSETLIGEALKDYARDEIIIATKVALKMGDGINQRGASRHHIMNCVDASLERLDTDYIDLYQIHTWDDSTSDEETMRALDDLVRWGKVRYIGASNYAGWQLTHANAVAGENGWQKFVSVQPHYHMLERSIEKELIPACNFFGIGILPYFPIAGGFLSGKYSRGEGAPPGSRGETSPYVQRYMTDVNYDRVEQLTAFAQDHGRGINDLAHAWLLATPEVSSVITGATRVDHVVSNAAAGDWVLSKEEKAEVDELLAE